MGIAAYNRGSRAISAYIDQKLQEARTVNVPVRMWSPPAGWYKAACAARDEAAELESRIEDNERRRKAGLPEYLP